MTTRSTFFSTALRVAVAATMLVGSFVALQQRYRGDCVIPDYEFGRYAPFLLLAALFRIAFAWLISELAFSFLAPVIGLRPFPARLLSIGVALGAYMAVGYFAWLSSPVPVDAEDDKALRAFMSVFWNVGFLVETGNFSDYSCGY